MNSTDFYKLDSIPGTSFNASVLATPHKILSVFTKFLKIKLQAYYKVSATKILDF